MEETLQEGSSVISLLKVVEMDNMSWGFDLLPSLQETPYTIPLNLFVLEIVTR